VRSKTTLTVSILGGVAVLTLAGCNNNPGTAGPAPSSTAAATSSAAAITNPLDTSKFKQNLCTALTAAQLAPYMGKVDSTNVENKSTSSACDLFPADGHMANISILYYPNLTASSMIASGANFPYSKNLAPTQGYPTQSTSQGNPPTGECSTSVAIADHEVVGIEAQSTSGNPNYNNMCVVSEALAPLLVSNIKAG
jgi:hypothetical protein